MMLSHILSISLHLFPLISSTVTHYTAAVNDTVATINTDENVTEVDSTKVRHLQEFVVEGDNAWIEGDKAVFIPTKGIKDFPIAYPLCLRG